MLNARTKTSKMDASSVAVAFLIIIGVVMTLSNPKPSFDIKEIPFERNEEKSSEVLKAS
jgi:hypothetical protein